MRSGAARALFALLGIGLWACVPSGQQDSPESPTPADDPRAEAPGMNQDLSAAHRSLSPRLMTLPGVAGVGESLCDGEPCLKVFVVALTPELEARIPSRHEGFRVVVEVSGEIRALPEDDSVS